MEQSNEPLLQPASEIASSAEIRQQDRKGALGAAAAETSQTDDLRQERGGDGAVAVDVAASPKARKLSSYKKTLGNMIVSIVGAGVLGLPYAFRRSGWAFSILALAVMVGRGSLVLPSSSPHGPLDVMHKALILAAAMLEL